MGTHWSVLSILYLSPLCHGYSLGVSCQSSICLQYVMGTHWECPDNRQFVSSMSWVLIGVSCQSSICLQYVIVLIGSVLTIVNLSPVCHGYSLECLVNPLFVSSMSWVLIGSVLTIVNLSPLCHGY